MGGLAGSDAKRAVVADGDDRAQYAGLRMVGRGLPRYTEVVQVRLHGGAS